MSEGYRQIARAKERNRLALVTLLLIAFWAALSLPHFFGGRPLDFQRAGSLLVAVTIVFIGVRRVSIENRLEWTQSAALAASINRLEAQRELSEEKLNLAIDVLKAQIAQMCEALSLPNPSGPPDKEALDALLSDLQERLVEASTSPARQDLKLASETKNWLLDELGLVSPWTKGLWYLEIFGLVLGTLQWGYGDSWVTAFSPGLASQ